MLRLSQDALAQRLGVTRQAISGWETGAFKPLIDQLPVLADALQLGLIDDLFEVASEKDNPSAGAA